MMLICYGLLTPRHEASELLQSSWPFKRATTQKQASLKHSKQRGSGNCSVSVLGSLSGNSRNSLTTMRQRQISHWQTLLEWLKNCLLGSTTSRIYGAPVRTRKKHLTARRTCESCSVRCRIIKQDRKTGCPDFWPKPHSTRIARRRLRTALQE